MYGSVVSDKKAFSFTFPKGTMLNKVLCWQSSWISD